MKLQKLTIHNIASIEDAVIDFEAYPLADSEVFLITGKTGSGKSTILDAICLALFANTPRLKGTQMEGNTRDEERDITIKDPRQLMRRSTGEASVTLTFTGSNGVHYKAAIGLDFNQFCRTTLLAQGEFTRFLNSSDADKAEILEKITGVDIYSKLGKKVYELTGDKEKDWKEAKRLLDGTTTMSDTEVAEKKQKIEEFETQYKAV